MTVYIEDFIPVIQFHGLNTNKPVTFGSTLEVTGALSGPSFFQTDASAATIAITAAMSGGTFLATKASATQTYTLPAVAEGLKYTFICGHASGEILVTPTGSVGTVFTSFAAVGVDADTGIITLTAGTGIKNTAATNAIGDSITLVSNGVGWYGVGITSGIWASQ